MIRGGEGGAAIGPGEASVSVSDLSAWAPLRQPAFRWLWLGVLISWTGTWMQTVGAQWLVVDASNAAVLVSLVQAATTLPVMLLALPGGVLADSFDRRWLLFTVQVYFFIVGILLAALTAVGQMPPVLLLAFTFLLGVGTAVQLPGWGATLPELVPRTQLRAASRLDLVGVNVSRAVGPALAGLVIAHLGGVPVVFALNAISVVFLAIALLFWRRPQPDLPSRERFVRALRAGGRYVWHEPVVRRILLRAIMFVTPGMALWALLPLIASQHLRVGADGFGALFGALGAGAVLGAWVLGRVKTSLSTNAILIVGGVLYAAALAVLIVVTSFPAALVTLVLSGVAWMAVTSTLQAELQLVLPAWVRARGFAIYLVTFTGCQTAGALLCGLLANRVGLRPTVLAAAVVVLAGAVAGLFRRVPEDRPPRPAAGRLLDRRPAGVRPRARHRTRPRRRPLHRHLRAAGGLPDRHGPPAPISAPNRRDPLGAVPRCRTPRPLRRDLPRPVLGGTSAPTRGPADRHRPGDRGGRASLLRSPGHG
jgi:predicted MFS family arabinose efflux permease